MIHVGDKDLVWRMRAVYVHIYIYIEINFFYINDYIKDQQAQLT